MALSPLHSLSAPLISPLRRRLCSLRHGQLLDHSLGPYPIPPWPATLFSACRPLCNSPLPISQCTTSSATLSAPRPCCDALKRLNCTAPSMRLHMLQGIAVWNCKRVACNMHCCRIWAGMLPTALKPCDSAHTWLIQELPEVGRGSKRCGGALFAVGGTRLVPHSSSLTMADQPLYPADKFIEPEQLAELLRGADASQVRTRPGGAAPWCAWSMLKTDNALPVSEHAGTSGGRSWGRFCRRPCEGRRQHS